MLNKKKFNVSKKQLKDLYIKKQLSSIKIANLLNFSQATILKYLKKYHIVIRSLGETTKGKSRSNEIKEKISKSWTEERKQKQSIKNKGSKPKNLTFAGHQHSEKFKFNQSKNFSGKNNPMFGRVGKLNPGWISPEKRKTLLNKQIRSCYKTIEWRTAVFKRDNYTCQFCSIQGGRLQADHIIPLSVLIKKNNITNLDQALEFEELWNIKNGRTLCYKCHLTTDTWGKRGLKND